MITFGIITDGSEKDRVNAVIDSIFKECPRPQIIVVGPNNNHFDYFADTITEKGGMIDDLNFDESIKPAWITKKKNLITQHARYDNVVYMHDYIKLRQGWYNGFCIFDKRNCKWQVQMNKIINLDGTRYRDWVSWKEKVIKPYHWIGQKDMYISGAYWVAKKNFMEKYPLDESKSWGESEDVEWCSRWKDKEQVYYMNTHSGVQLLKQKDKVFPIHD